MELPELFYFSHDTMMMTAKFSGVNETSWKNNTQKSEIVSLQHCRREDRWDDDEFFWGEKKSFFLTLFFVLLCVVFRWDMKN